MGEVVNVDFRDAALIDLQATILRYEAAARELFGLTDDAYWEDSVTEKLRDQYFRRVEGTWIEPQPLRRKARGRVRSEAVEHP